MSILIFSIVGIVFLYFLFSKKSLSSPMLLFAATWGVIMFGYETDTLEMTQVSNRTYLIILLGVVSFVIGCLLSSLLTTYTSEPGNTLRTKKNLSFRYNILLILCVSTIIVLLPEAMNSIQILRGGGTFTDIRFNYSEGNSVINNPIIAVYRNYIVKPFCVAIYPLCAYDMIMGEKKKWFFVSGIIIALFSMLYEGGRTQFVYLAIHFLLIYSMTKREATLSPKTKKRIRKLCIFVIVIMVIAVAGVSLSRGVADFGRSMKLYIYGCVPMLDHYTEDFLFSPEYHYGAVTFVGILKSVFGILGNIGIGMPQFVLDALTVLEVEDTITIGYGVEMNAYVSVFYYFFNDGGFFALVVGMLLYGLICKTVYEKAMRSGSARWIIAYALLAQGLIFSMIRLQFVISQYCLAFILVPFLFKEINVRRDKI